MATERQRCACGTLLDRYNKDDSCARCVRARRGTTADSSHLDPPQLPQDFWQSPEVLSAIGAQEFGDLSRLVRQQTRLTQNSLAQLVGLTQGFISKLESGTTRLEVHEKVLRFLEGLGAPVLLRPGLPQVSPRTTTGTSAAPGDAPRDLHQLAAIAAAESLNFASQYSTGTTTSEEVDEIRRAIATIATEYVHSPIEPVFTRLLATREQLFTLLREQPKPREAMNLFFLTGTTCLLLAHASQNLGDEAAAMAQIRTAWTCADRADHNGLRAWVRGTAALIAEWSPQAQDAFTHTQSALAYAPTGESRIRIAAIQARAAARIGDEQRARSSLNVLRHAREEWPDADGLEQFGGLLSFPTEKQAFYIGGTYTLLGDYSRAEQHAKEAIKLYEQGTPEAYSYGDVALARLDIVTVRLAKGELEGASAELRKILELPPQLRIRQLGTAVQRVAGLLSHKKFDGNRTARELADAAVSYRTMDSQEKAPLQ
ncbi:helix-turn-helix domain-containing protein [Streptomyces sp. NPDC015032]|uniref:helix-turn-helix domain-containing protein n=1 Tax=Streptomyces sp. NPDC015032 TaxID=3364937 RepID=UPI0036F9B6B9